MKINAASIFIKNIPAGASLELIDSQGKRIWESQGVLTANIFETLIDLAPS